SHRLLRATRHSFTIRGQYEDTAVSNPFLHIVDIAWIDNNACIKKLLQVSLLQPARIRLVNTTQHNKFRVRIISFDFLCSFNIFKYTFFRQQSSNKNKPDMTRRRIRIREKRQIQTNTTQNLDALSLKFIFFK